MIDRDDNQDETEAVCAPMIRLYATVEGHSSPSASNGNAHTDFDQTEPCDWAPIIRLQAEVNEEPGADSEDLR